MAILSSAPESADVLDLGAARAARAEARGDAKQYIKLSAGFIEVRPELPIEAAFLFQAEDVRGGLALMLVDPADVDALMADGLSAEDLAEIAKFTTGKPLGE